METATDKIYLPPVVQHELDEGRVLLKDGSTALLRQAKEEDLPKVVDLLESVSDESRYRRFFSGSRSSEELARRLLQVGDPEEELTLVILHGHPGNLDIVGMGSYVRLENSPDVAEPAFLVRDDYHGRGIGTLLLERLALMAVKNGIKEFEAHTLPDNRKMKDVFEKSGFPVKSYRDDGSFKVTFPVLPNKEMVELSEFRDRVATVASLKPFFEPEGVAVIGASRETGSIGSRIVNALLNGNFTGEVYPVNPSAESIAGVQCYESVTAIEATVDLAVIVVPRDAVESVIDDCHEKDVPALVTITAGFSETVTDGKKRQKELAEKLFGYGMRMIGPNCLGLLNTDPKIRLNASFSPVFPREGNVAIASQSGALGLAILDYASSRNIGFSSFVSIGSKIDVSGNDLIQYWSEDKRTDVILLYLESFGNPRRFARLTKNIGTKKPIIVVKGGRSEGGRKAASAQTTSLSSHDIATEALFKQAGIIGVDSLEDTFDVASLLSSQPLPEGPGVAVVTNSGGPAILSVDACEKMGLKAISLTTETRDHLAQFLPETASLSNPVDMVGSAGPEEYRRTLEIIHQDPGVDAIIVVYTPLDLDPDEEIVNAVEDGIRNGRHGSGRTLPVAGVFIQPENERSQLSIGDETIPTYRFPEAAAQALGHAYQHKSWTREIENHAPKVPKFDDISTKQAREICRQEAEDNPVWLGINDANDVLEHVGIETAETHLATSPDQAVSLAGKIGYPVVLKMSSRTLVHKSEWDGVKLELETESEVRSAYETIKQTLKEANRLEDLDGVAVQPHVDRGIELMAGMTEDEVFGPLITFGLGGIYVEILEDVSVRITPLSDYDVDQMLSDIKGSRLLDGYRGAPPADKDALRELLLRLSILVEDVPEIKEMDLNPIKAFEPGDGYAVLDTRIKVAGSR